MFIHEKYSIEKTFEITVKPLAMHSIILHFSLEIKFYKNFSVNSLIYTLTNDE